jgi:hypothetical protein
VAVTAAPAARAGTSYWSLAGVSVLRSALTPEKKLAKVWCCA